ncbi:MAG: hypothetical protein HW380_2723 [Magnetococcales bacterium]|nr:hypothetical protein [Magnetococcales bacterium]
MSAAWAGLLVGLAVALVFFANQSLESAHGPAKTFSGLTDEEVVQTTGKIQGTYHADRHGETDAPAQSHAEDRLLLHVGEPFSPGFSVGVGDFIAELRGFASEDVFSGHGAFLLLLM